MTNEATILTTPNEIRYYQLAAVKGMIRMEAQGFKSRGGSVRKKWAIHLGLKSSASHEAVCRVLEAQMFQLELDAFQSVTR